MRKFSILLVGLAVGSGCMQALDYVPVLKEGFSKSESSTPGGGYYAESLYFTAADHADNDGWYSNSVYEARKAVKFNAKTKTGYLLSPALQLSSDVAKEVKVQFRGQTWTKDNIYICVEIDGDTSTVQKIDSDVSTNITDRSEAPFEVTFTNVPNGSKLKFYAEKRSDKLHRFFLSDIVVLEGVEEYEGETMYPSTYYHGFEDHLCGNDTETRTLHVTASGLTDPIVIDRQSRSDFTVTLGDDWDDLTGGTLNVAFTPNNAGHKLETLTVKSGLQEEKILLEGLSKVYRPVIAEATDIAADGFTANWEPASGMDFINLKVYTKEEAPLVATNLMFTKYIEGKSNNRAVEIFNGTGQTVNLKGWKLRMESNGAGGLTACEYALPDKDLENGQTFTLCNAQFGALRDIADATIGFQDGGYANITTFTGDDALGLFDPDDSLVDLLGYESYDCNDLVSGNWGQDVTYYRRSDSYAPHPKFYVEEWDRHDMDYCEGYGSHTLDTTGPVRNVIHDVILGGNETSYQLSGLEPGRKYYYSVLGLSGALMTPGSYEAEVILDTTGVDGIAADNDATVEYFNLTGMRIAHPETGICIRRQGNKVEKIIIA